MTGSTGNGSNTEVAEEEDYRSSNGRSNSRNVGSRGGGKSDSQSAGRKIAAKLYPLDESGNCEWQGKANCGGGDYPILGCLEGKQQARHHGPEKNVQNNEQGNVHRICHYCIGREMRILTSSMDWIKAEDVTVGLELIGFDENLQRQGRPRLRRSIVEGIQTVREPSYKFTMQDGTELVSSHKHQWVGSPTGRLNPSWRTSESLVKNPTHPNSKYTLRKLFNTWEFNNTYDMGYLAAMLDSEGSLSGGHLNYAQKEGSVFNKTADLIYKLVGTGEETIYDGTNYVMNKYRLTDRKSIATVLGTCKPIRLMDKWNEYLDTKAPQAKGSVEIIASSEYLGEQEVVSIQTSTRTLIVEGYASHNCHYRWHAKNDPTYDWNAGIWPPHNPRPLTPDEEKEQAVDLLRYMSTKRSTKVKELD